MAPGTLRQILGQAVANEIVSVNVVDQWKAVQPKASARSKAVAVENVLDSEEREHLLQVAELVAPTYFPFILFLAETGCRVSEVISLRLGGR